MTISNYGDLLAEAAQQAQPQRLLFTFAKVSLPEKSNEQQKKPLNSNKVASLALLCVLINCLKN